VQFAGDRDAVAVDDDVEAVAMKKEGLNTIAIAFLTNTKFLRIRRPN
jgi:hypothetical protein